MLCEPCNPVHVVKPSPLRGSSSRPALPTRHHRRPQIAAAAASNATSFISLSISSLPLPSQPSNAHHVCFHRGDHRRGPGCACARAKRLLPLGGGPSALLPVAHPSYPHSTHPLTHPQIQVNNGSDSDAAGAGAEGADVSIPASIQNRSERKSRKSLQNIGLKRVTGITRVTMKRPRGVSAPLPARGLAAALGAGR